MTSVVITLPPSYESVREAQDTVADFCADAGLASARDIAVLLTSELVTNVVLHARTELELRVALRGDCVRVEVCDLDPSPPVARDAAPEEPSGRGLGLLTAMSGRWGVTTSSASDGKVVWFELPV